MKQFRIIAVGCGSISYRWFDHIAQRDDAEVLAIVELDEERARRSIEKYGFGARIYRTLADALAHEKGNIVLDLTFVTVHHEIVIQALRAGYDVLGEKPMAMSVEQANKMVRVADETGKKYILMQNRRYIDQVQKIRALIASGLMGDPVMVCGEIFVGADMGSIRNQLKYPQLQDNNIHIFDQARFMTGRDPLSVYYHSYNPKGSKYDGDAAGMAIFEFTEGCAFSFHGYNGAEGFHTSWDHNWRILCERGTILWDGFGDVSYQYADKVGVYQYKDGVILKPEVVRDQHDLALEDIFAALKENRTPGTDCRDNLHSIAMVFASVKSIEEKRKVGIVVHDREPYIVLH